MAWGALLALFLSIIAAVILYHALKKIWPLILNGIFGVIVFWVLSYIGLIKIPIDWLTFAIAAIGGIFGVVIVIILAALGVPL